MTIPAFKKIIEYEIQNFESSLEYFEDIISWAERIKHLLHVTKFNRSIFEYFLLCHILHNSYLNAILLAMKGYIFHSYAVCRLGVESFINLAIIECHKDEHFKIWKGYNYTKRDHKDWNHIKKKYDKIFRDKRKSHDYSSFLRDNEKIRIFSSWEMLSNMGSHSSYMQSMFSLNISDPKNLKSGLFDVEMKDKTLIGRVLLWIIDTYFTMANPLSDILERNNLSLNTPNDKIDKMIIEWNEFKLKKAKDFNIDLNKYL